MDDKQGDKCASSSNRLHLPPVLEKHLKISSRVISPFPHGLSMPSSFLKWPLAQNDLIWQQVVNRPEFRLLPTSQL